VVCQALTEPIWEKDPNRIADLDLLRPTAGHQTYVFEDLWEKFEVRPRVVFPCSDPGVHVEFNVKNHPSVRMNRGRIEDVNVSKYGTGVETWSAKMTLGTELFDIGGIEYSYSVVKRNNIDPERECSRRFYYNPSNSYPAQGSIVNGYLDLHPDELLPSFEVFQISGSRITIGSFPQTENDIIQLRH
jgi:hypothetical protein